MSRWYLFCAQQQSCLRFINEIVDCMRIEISGSAQMGAHCLDFPAVASGNQAQMSRSTEPAGRITRQAGAPSDAC